MEPREKSSLQIEQDAADWLARRDREDWCADDEEAFNAWLAQSTLHVVAYVRLEAAWNATRSLKALSAGVPRGHVPSPDSWLLPPRFFGKGRISTHAGARAWRPAQLRAAAAGLLLALGAGIALYLWPDGSTYRTPVGGLASMSMADGSKITLNTDSVIRFSLTPTERRIELDRGEALFDVVRDPLRPFVVATGGKHISAVGTRFSVRLDGDDVRVFVAEGRVSIEDDDKPLAQQHATGKELVMLSAGSMARAGGTGVQVENATVAEIESQLSWRSGHLVFRNSSLADAVAEFNRYNTRRIVIDDAAVGAIRVSGKFRSTQSEAFVRLLEEGFRVRAHRVEDEIVLTGSAQAREQ